MPFYADPNRFSTPVWQSDPTQGKAIYKYQNIYLLVCISKFFLMTLTSKLFQDSIISKADNHHQDKSQHNLVSI